MVRSWKVLLSASALAGCVADTSVDEIAPVENSVEIGADEANVLDRRFSTSGLWVSNTTSLTEQRRGEAVATDSKGRVIVGATYNGSDGAGRLSIHRLGNDGKLDATFSTDGIVDINVGGTGQQVLDIYVEPSTNKIVAVGTKTFNNVKLFVAIRLNENGTLDNTFGTLNAATGLRSGIQAVPFSTTTTTYNAVASEIVKFGSNYALAGSAKKTDGTQNFALAMLTSAGELATTFSTDGKHLVDFPSSTSERVTGLAVIPNSTSGDVLVAVGPVALSPAAVGLVGLNASGGLHSAFNAGALRTHQVTGKPMFPESVVVDGSDLLVTGMAKVTNSAGTIVSRGFVSRYVNGVAQNMASGETVQTLSFGETNSELVSIARFVRTRSTGNLTRFLVAGSTWGNGINKTVLAAVSRTGALDVEFDGDGKIVAPLPSSVSEDPMNSDAGDLDDEFVRDMVLTSNARIYTTGVVAKTINSDTADEAFALIHDVEPHFGNRFDNTGTTTPPWINSYLLGRLSDITYLDNETSRVAHLASLGGVTELDFVDDPNSDAQALVASTQGALIVAVRGTESDSANDILTDLQSFNRVTYGTGEVHRGFYNEMIALLPSVETLLRANLGTKKLFVTGHSLGGAVAHLLAYELRRRGFTATRVVTFAAPKSGNQAWADMYTPALGSVTDRFVMEGDFIPTLPPLDTRFVHVGKQHYIDWSNTGATTVVWNDTVTHSAAAIGFPVYHGIWKYNGQLIHTMPNTSKY